MYFEILRLESELRKGRFETEACENCEMEGRGRRNSVPAGPSAVKRTRELVATEKKALLPNYFGMESCLLLLCLTVSLLILPLILPPLPPPPSMLLLLPIGILVVLMVLAFMPSDVRNIASSYL
uniref:ARGOS-like protein n=1 Tax=Ananas comosus var. bracteatus TaxID=296719 RepID=A0A6V7NNF7_ANACO|nr:unnamed protein product [Ananas comosus var. bracteatus]